MFIRLHSLAVPAVLRPSRNRPGTVFADPLGECFVGAAGVDVDGLGGLRDITLELVGGDELPLARVPRVEHLGRGRAA